MAKLADNVHPYVVSQANFAVARYSRARNFLSARLSTTVSRKDSEELVKEFSHLTLAQVYDALSYYDDNKELIDKDIRDNSASAASDTAG